MKTWKMVNLMVLDVNFSHLIGISHKEEYNGPAPNCLTQKKVTLGEIILKKVIVLASVTSSVESKAHTHG